MSTVAVACCQLQLAVGELDANRAAGQAAIAAAAQEGAQIIVLPELANSGYVFDSAEEARESAEPLDGPTVAAWTELARAHAVTIAGGLCEWDTEAEVLRNTGVIVDAAGLRAAYRKAHLWDSEHEVFAPGDRPPPVIDTPHGRIAVMVCYDLEFPEWVRLAALAGADLLCAPTNWPLLGRPPAGERPADVVRVQANASVNRIFIAVCDRAAAERGVEWVSGTLIVGPDGYPLAGPVCEDAAVTVVAECRLDDARRKRTSPRNDALADRRPDLYGPVSG